MKLSWLVVPAITVALVACSGGDPLGGIDAKTATAPATANVVAPLNDGITLTTQTPERVTGVYRAENGVDTLQFDLAKVGTDIYADLTGDNGRPIVHIDTTGDDYTFSYMGGGLQLHTTKTFIASQIAANNPQGVSTSGFAFTGDMHVLDDMIKLPEVAFLPTLSRALGVRGITGSDFPSSLVLHKMGRQAADSLNIHVQPIDAPAAGADGYCQAYPNSGDQCYGMCGDGCNCWSWVCGDCCYHNGCAQHDTWCRDGEWYYCYNITAVVALFGC